MVQVENAMCAGPEAWSFGAGLGNLIAVMAEAKAREAIGRRQWPTLAVFSLHTSHTSTLATNLMVCVCVMYAHTWVWRLEEDAEGPVLLCSVSFLWDRVSH